jgi:hypothetical protein
MFWAFWPSLLPFAILVYCTQWRRETELRVKAEMARESTDEALRDEAGQDPRKEADTRRKMVEDRIFTQR